MTPFCIVGMTAAAVSGQVHLPAPAGLSKLANSGAQAAPRRHGRHLSSLSMKIDSGNHRGNRDSCAQNTFGKSSLIVTAKSVIKMAAIPDPAPNSPGHAAEDLLPLVYEDLRKLAAHRLSRLAPGQTLQPTALVHDAWLRMAAEKQRSWANRAHFFAAAAEVMRQVLVDYVRRRTRLKRGGGQLRLDIDEVELACITPDEKVLLIDEALERLGAADPSKARIVVLKFFGGLTDREVALNLGVTERTVERHWAYAKAWLLRSIGEAS
jgi:RNA polymerase sigma factor (TIGR02999 family)